MPYRPEDWQGTARRAYEAGWDDGNNIPHTRKNEITDEIVERAAKAIVARRKTDWSLLGGMQNSYKDDARAALEAALNPGEE